MPDMPQLDPNTTALLLMDFQESIVAGHATDQEALLVRTAALQAVARKAGVLVGHVVVGFRPGYPEVSPRNMSFSAIRQTNRFIPTDKQAGVHPALGPHEGEFVVTKHRVGAFHGTDLEVILRSHGIDTLLLAGIATGGVVLSTLRHAADADYRIVAVSDCCSDKDEEVHRVLLERVFPRQAHVATAAEVIKALG